MSGYEHVTVEDLPDAPSPTRHKREIDEAVGATEFGFNVYVAEPGEQLPWGYHHHPDHEEAFYVVTGEVRFETPDGEFLVGSGEAFFVSPGAPQKGVAVGDERAHVIAVGAPKASDEAVVRELCPECGERTGRDYETTEEDGRSVVVLSCAECGTETLRFGEGPD